MKTDWEIKKLGEVCSFYRGLTYSKKDEVEFSKNAVLRSNNIDLATNKLDLSEIKYISDKIDVDNSKKVQQGSLLICTANGSKTHLGKVALIDSDYDYAFGGFMGLIKPNENIYPLFLYYQMTSGHYKDFIKSLSDGANINNLKFNDLALFEIPVPPLAEQKRIVEILDQKFAQIETLKNNAQKNLQNAKELFQSELEKVLSNISWKKKNLGSLSTEKMSYGSSSPSCNYNGEIRYIRITDINDNGFLNEEFVSPKNYEEKHILKDGDIVFARTGATVGKAYCYKESEGKSVYAGYLIRLRPNRELVIPDFIYLNTKSKDYENFIKNSQAAAAQPNVNAEKYSNYEIPLPPLAEQQKIVEHLDSLQEKIRELEAIYTKQIVNCDELKQSFLKKAFEGEL